MMHRSAPARLGQHRVQADAGGRRVDQPAAGHQRGRLGQPGREPEALDLALRLIARAGAAVETVEARAAAGTAFSSSVRSPEVALPAAGRGAASADVASYPARSSRCQHLAAPLHPVAGIAGGNTAMRQRSRSGRSQTGAGVASPHGTRPSLASSPRAAAARPAHGQENSRQRPGRAAGQQHRQRRPGQRILDRGGSEFHRHQRPDGARPAQFMPEQRAAAPVSGTVVAGTVAPAAPPARARAPGGPGRCRRPDGRPAPQARRSPPASRAAAPWWRRGNPAARAPRDSNAPGRKLWVICSRRQPRRPAHAVRRQPGIQRRQPARCRARPAPRRRAPGNPAARARRCRRSPARRAAPPAAC